MSHASRNFVIVANADGTNAHAVSNYGDKDQQDVLCYGFAEKTPRLGKNVVGPVGCYDGVATYEGEICPTCRRVADGIAATDAGFKVRGTLETAYRSGAAEVTITREALASILASLAPWKAQGLGVRPDGAPLTGEA